MISTSEKSLYERLGGYDAVAAFVDDPIPRLTGDPEIGVYWRGHSTSSKRRERQLIVDFLCESLGGPVVYTGRDMRTAHEGLDITERDWEIFVKHTIATLDKLEIRGKEWDDCMAIVAGVQVDVVERA